MATRPIERIRVETDAGSFDRFQSIEVTHDITAPSQAVFEIGDDGSWKTLRDIVKHGAPFKVWQDNRLRLTGRVYSNEIPVDAAGGSTIQVVVRTKMADAFFASADPAVRVTDTSIKDFLLALYQPLGYAAADFVFAASLERDLITGVGTKGAKAPADLDPIKLDAAKVSPPESIYEAAARHLKRFHLMHWDTADGRIYVGAPDDAQRPAYRLQSRRAPGARGAGNNLLSARRTMDWSDVPTDVKVFGGTSMKDAQRSAFQSTDAFDAAARSGAAIKLNAAAVEQARAVAGHLDVLAAGFNRPVIVKNEQIRTQAQATSAARRELAQRSRRKDCWELTTDGWSIFDGHRNVPVACNTTVDVDVDNVEGGSGRYYVQRVGLRQTPREGRVVTLSVVAPGTMVV